MSNAQSGSSRTVDLLIIVLAVLVAAAAIATWGPRPSDLRANAPSRTAPNASGQPGGPGTSGEVSPCGWTWAPAASVLVDLPQGASRMWICDGAVRKPVTQGIQAVVDQILAQPPTRPSDQTCVSWGSTGVVFLDYPNGSRVGFSWDTSCQDGGVAGRWRPDRAVVAIRGAYETQYGGGAPHDPDDDANPCRPRQFTLIDSPARTVASLTLCRGRLDAAHGATQTTPATLTTGDVVRVMAGLRPSPGDPAEQGKTPPPADAVLLRGVFPQGITPDTATMWWSEDRIWTSGGRAGVWQLSDSARAVLERYRDGAVPSSPAPGPRDAAGTSPCAAPPAPSKPATLPDRPVAAWLCTDTSNGIKVAAVPDPLTLDPQALVDVYAGLGKVDSSAACRADLGPSYQLVLRYPDRDVAVVGELFGCEVVGARLDAPGLLTAFRTLLAHQRETVPAPPTSGSPCAATPGWMPVRLDQVDSMVRCSGGEAELPSWLVDELRANSQIALTREPAGGSTTTLTALAATAPDGSVIAIEWDGEYGWFSINDQWYRWRPSARAKQALP